VLKAMVSALVIVLISAGTADAQLRSVRQTIYGMD